MLKSRLSVQKCGNERGVSQCHLQLAALLRFVAHPPPLGCVIHDAPSGARELAPRAGRIAIHCIVHANLEADHLCPGFT
jgi:hypothetical protein